MTEEKQTSPGKRFRWPVFGAIIAILVLFLLAIYFFVYLRVGG